MHRRSVVLGLCIAVALGVSGKAATFAKATAAKPSATLKKIESRLESKTGVVAIEASAPVPYVASQPDPRSFVVELRDVAAAGFDDAFKKDPRHPIAALKVEDVEAFDGVTVTRVYMTLTHPMRPRVRSSRNLIYVEADRADGTPTVPGVISMAGPSPVIRDVRVTQRGTAVAVTLLGTSRLVATNVHEPRDGPRRIVVDLPNVSSAVAAATPVRQGPVERVRIGFNPEAPLVTQVTMDLSRTAPYRIESSNDGNDLTIVFDEPVADPIAALTSTSAKATVNTSASAEATVDRPSASRLTAIPPSGTSTPPIVTQAVAAAAAPAAQAAPAPAAAPVQQPPPPPQAPPPAEQQRFTGVPISLDFQDTDLRAVLRTFADVSGLNVVIDPTIQGAVDLKLTDVPWDQALDIILKANKLGYIADGPVIRIAPLTVLADEEAQRRKLAEEQALSGELRVMSRSLSYARATDLIPTLTATALSQRGSVQVDGRTNTIIITDLADRLQRASELLTLLDRPEPQVEIEARIVQTTREFAQRIGVQWGFNGRADPALGNTTGLSFPNQGSVTGRTGISQGPPPPAPGTDAVSNMVNLGVTGATTGIGVALGSINGALNLDVALSALERNGQGRILSTPRISTQNNVEAEIMQGVQIPVQTVANNTVTVTFRDAALILRVVPQITATNTVIMRIVVENASPDFSRAVNNIPPIDTQKATTQVLVNDGDTTVIGGIYVSREQALQDRVPALHRIPLLGWLFKRNELADESRELLIFITPRILRLT
jgi:type IV pilus assembly protein PilQ